MSETTNITVMKTISYRAIITNEYGLNYFKFQKVHFAREAYQVDFNFRKSDKVEKTQEKRNRRLLSRSRG